MLKQDTKLSFKDQTIYVGLDIAKKSWNVTILTEDFFHKTFTQPPIPDVLVGYLKRNFPDAHYICAYEAGLFGFWICSALKRLGADCIVVHPSDIRISILFQSKSHIRCWLNILHPFLG